VQIGVELKFHNLENVRVSAIVFDLDGTLIDSAPSILSSFEIVLERHGIESCESLGPHLIGPPLLPTLARISGLKDAEELNILADAFRKFYDTEGYLATVAYDGVASALRQLRGRGIKLYVVTNKRMQAAQLILDYFGWTSWFEAIYAQDTFTPSLSSKTAVLKYVIQRYGIDVERGWYVGDRREDAEAALANGLRFAWAHWGYDPALDLTAFMGAVILKTPLDMSFIKIDPL